jgi:hypothetical protein
MPLSSLTWKMLPPVTISSSATPHGILDAIYQCGTQTRYVDGTLKSSASTSWTWSKDNSNTINSGLTTAVYAEPTSPGASLFGQRVIFAGSTSTPGAIKYLKPAGDTWASTKILMGTAIGRVSGSPGSYGTWSRLSSDPNGGTPFTSGQFTGYISFGYYSTASTIMIFESQESVAVFMLNSTGSILGVCFSGAYIDPISSDLLNAESDGRLYGLSSAGTMSTAGSTMPTNWLTLGTGNANLFQSGSTGNASNYSCVFTPGSGTIKSWEKFMTYAAGSSFISRSGNIPRIPIQVKYTTGNFCGQLREIYVTRSGAMGGALYELGTIHGYFIGASGTAAAGEAVLLKG